MTLCPDLDGIPDMLSDSLQILWEVYRDEDEIPEDISRIRNHLAIALHLLVKHGETSE